MSSLRLNGLLLGELHQSFTSFHPSDHGKTSIKEEDKRVVQVNIRLTEAEHDWVNTYAEAAGITPANWIRQKVFTEKFPQIKVSPLDAASYRELHKIGVNQAVKAMHLGKQPNLITIIGSLLSQQNYIINGLSHDSRPSQRQRIKRRNPV